ncbi:MAG TPA: acetyl-CoA carboxylase, carboxyltransferase subunit beta [Candidatus Saccharimonadales bacterium]|nr:acetyl-CoA carboxylase, carboxyltransferase subunit beta [Candidatus Saccharimonadales bacterium]
MTWLDRKRETLKGVPKRDLPGGLWIKCDGCGEILYKKELEKTLWTCPSCDHHFRVPGSTFIRILTDEFTETDRQVVSADPLGFAATKRYTDQLRQARQKTGLPEALITGSARLEGLPFWLGVMDFGFMGGSMGSAVGDKFARLGQRALESRQPLVVSSASGGARMQEGVLSLMQLARTCVRLAELQEAGVPFISIMTHPTTGGTTASFASLGDVILAEPRALIGFAGARVIAQTIRQELPPGFQRAEFLLEHGMLDRVVHRKDLRSTLSFLLRFYAARTDGG